MSSWIQCAPRILGYQCKNTKCGIFLQIISLTNEVTISSALIHPFSVRPWQILVDDICLKFMPIAGLRVRCLSGAEQLCAALKICKRAATIMQPHEGLCAQASRCATKFLDCADQIRRQEVILHSKSDMRSPEHMTAAARSPPLDFHLQGHARLRIFINT